MAQAKTMDEVDQLLKNNLTATTPFKAQATLLPPPVGGGLAVGSATGNPRNKVALQKGFGLMDWVRLSKSGRDLTGGLGGPRLPNGQVREITRAELARHKRRSDAWMALNGAVYNVTAYMEFHPGGWDELMKGAGKDATKLFNSVHRWVNYESMLSACLIGKLVEGPLLPPPMKTSGSTISARPVIPPIVSSPPAAAVKPAMDYFQTDDRLTVNIFTRRAGGVLGQEHVIVDNLVEEQKLRILIQLPLEQTYLFHYKLAGRLGKMIGLRVTPAGKVEVDLEKEAKGRWTGIGEPLPDNGRYGSQEAFLPFFRPYEVVSQQFVTHNTMRLVLKSYNSNNGHLLVAPGRHVQFRHFLALDKNDSNSVELVRSYTPIPPQFAVSEEIRDKWSSPKFLHFLIKVYPNGALTPVLGRLQPGGTVQVSDPCGTFMSSTAISPFLGVTATTGDDSMLFLLAAGTGITPMLSMLPTLERSAEAALAVGRRRRVVLVYFNRGERDIISHYELDRYAQQQETWFALVHVLSNPESDWGGGGSGQRGHIRRELLAQYIKANEDGAGVGQCAAAVCGPPGFMQEAERLLLEDFHLKPDQLHLFQG